MASSDRQLVQIEPNEDANTVRDRLAFLRGQRVLLIWPEEGTALTRKLDLVLIQREAMRRAIRLAFVTHDPQVIEHARELNISTFETIGASERGRWKRGRAKVFTNRYQRPKDNPDADDLRPVASRLRIQPTLSKVQSLLLRTLILGALLAVVLGVVYVLVPSATIILTPAEQRVEAAVQILVDSEAAAVDVENAVVPATRLVTDLTETVTIEATGQRDLGDVRSVGSVVFINQTNRLVDVPADTTVSTSAGTSPVTFRTTQDAVVPAGEGQQVEVPIEARFSAAGAAGNVDANVINTVIGPLSEDVTVRNLTPTSGGQSRVVSVVTEDDLDRLLTRTRQQLQERAASGMENEISANQTLVVETLHIAEEREDWKVYTAASGDVSEQVSLTMRAVVEAMAIDTRLGEEIALAQMSAQIPRGRAIRPESITYQPGDVLVNGDAITFTMTGSGVVEGRINVGAIREQVAGRSMEAAMDYLINRVDLQTGTTPQINLSPGWFNRMPLLPMRIDVQISGDTA